MCSRDKSWRGDIRQSCSGRLVSTGNSSTPPLLTLLLLVAGICLFFIFPASFFYFSQGNSAPFTIGTILSVVFLYCFFFAAFTDPGVLPPAETPLYLLHELRPPRNQHLVSNGGRKTLKYCDQCSIFRPPKVEHCPTCNNCVLKFDHHCPWVGNCIGLRNYRYFYGFLVSLSFFVILSFGCSLGEIIIRASNNEPFGNSYAGSLSLLVYSIFGSLFAFGLCGMHTYLILMDLTTYDLIRHKGTDRKFHLGRLKSVYQALFGPLPTSLIRQHYSELSKNTPDSVAREALPKDYRLNVLNVEPKEDGIGYQLETV